MKTAFVVFNDLTLLDFIGPYDVLARLKSMGIKPDFEWDICAFTQVVHDDKGLAIMPTKIGQPLDDYDLLIVSGGMGTRSLYLDQTFISWIKTAQSVPLKTSVYTGSSLLGTASFLKTKKATTHFILMLFLY